MSKSNMLSIEAKKMLKEYKVLEGVKDFKPKVNYLGREHFFADKIITLAIGNINNTRRKKIESNGDRFSWRDTYNPYQSTMIDVRNYIIKEITSEHENPSSISK